MNNNKGTVMRMFNRSNKRLLLAGAILSLSACGGGGSSGGDDAGLLPGFTAMVGIGGLAAAALLRGNEDEE